MKKIIVIICTAFLAIGFFSCTPENITDKGQTPQASCGEDIDIPPPPPPPYGENGG